MARHRHILTLGFGDEFESMSDRFLDLGFRAVRATLAEDGVRALARCGEPIRAVLLAVPHALGDLGFALDRLREHAPTPVLRFAATGSEPGPSELEELGEAGVELALWKPFDDAALRFVLNEALRDPHRIESRRELRAPTAMTARVLSAAGTKSARVYNLSAGGAFLETPRPTPARGRVSVELPLPSGTLAVEAQVATTNVPGNIQKPSLPMGMGVEFTDLSEEARRALTEHVDALADRFRIRAPE
jgi:hypothetical protein